MKEQMAFLEEIKKIVPISRNEEDLKFLCYFYVNENDEHEMAFMLVDRADENNPIGSLFYPVSQLTEEKCQAVKDAFDGIADGRKYGRHQKNWEMFVHDVYQHL